MATSKHAQTAKIPATGEGRPKRETLGLRFDKPSSKVIPSSPAKCAPT
jgi:hypothetical protein